jgi:hypothetical protein
VKLFHKFSQTGAARREVYLRVGDIQAIFPTSDGCVVTIRGAAEDLWLTERADEVLGACGYNAAVPGGAL